MSRVDVIVVGAGVSGLTVAHEFLSRGRTVRIWAARRPPHTTADVAAAFWFPFLLTPSPRVEGWLRHSYSKFGELAADPRTGVVMREVFEVFDDHAPPPPAWMQMLGGLRPMEANELPEGRSAGRRFLAPVVETPRYMPWLLGQVEALGGEIEERTVEDLDEAFAGGAVVVNATGLGARSLASDPSVTPLEGVLVKVGHPEGDDPTDARVWLDEAARDGIAYVVPRASDIVLGGTTRALTDLPTGDPRSPEPHEVDGIVERCARLWPALRSAPHRELAVGYRPHRPEVRVEVQPTPKGLLVHDYGHGGAGVTLSWGCASALVDEVLRHEENGYPPDDAVPRTAS